MSERKKSYSEKLRDPRWQKKRLEILKNAGFKCEECSSEDEELHVHHCFYRKGASPWDYENNELICLCKSCHQTKENLLTKMAQGFGNLHNKDLEGIVTYLIPAIHVGPWSCRNLWQFLGTLELDFRVRTEDEK